MVCKFVGLVSRYIALNTIVVSRIRFKEKQIIILIVCRQKMRFYESINISIDFNERVTVTMSTSGLDREWQLWHPLSVEIVGVYQIEVWYKK